MDLLYDPNATYGSSSARCQKPCKFWKIKSILTFVCIGIARWRLIWMLNSDRQLLHCIWYFLPGFYVPQRYLLTFMGFLGLVMAYSMRLSLSVAITQMVPPPIFNMANLTTVNGEAPIICPFQDENYIHEHFDYQAIFDTLYSVCIFLIASFVEKI